MEREDHTSFFVVLGFAGAIVVLLAVGIILALAPHSPKSPTFETIKGVDCIIYKKSAISCNWEKFNKNRGEYDE